MELTQLGNKVSIASYPEDAILETISNQYPNDFYSVRLNCPEFTCLCEVTGQPDFATFVINYVPFEKLIESKSLKLFLCSFRNYNIFHEKCTVYIGKRLWEVLNPHYLIIKGFFYPRGGITIQTFWNKGELPNNVFILND